MVNYKISFPVFEKHLLSVRYDAKIIFISSFVVTLLLYTFTSYNSDPFYHTYINFFFLNIISELDL